MEICDIHREGPVALFEMTVGLRDVFIMRGVLAVLFGLEALFCLFCLISAIWFGRRVRMSLRTMYLLMNGTFFTLETLFEVTLYLSADPLSPTRAIAFVKQIGAIFLYMSIFLVSLTFWDLSLTPSLQPRVMRRRFVRKLGIFWGVFVLWLSVDAVWEFWYSQSDLFDALRIAGHTVFSAVPLYFGWRRLKSRMILRENFVTATSQRRKTGDKIRAFVVWAVLFLTIKSITVMVAAPLSFAENGEFYWAFRFCFTNITPFLLCLLFLSMNSRAPAVVQPSDVVAPLVDHAIAVGNVAYVSAVTNAE